MGNHTYTVYSAIFGNLRNQPLRISNLASAATTQIFLYMGVNAKPGASLRGWRELSHMRSYMVRISIAKFCSKRIAYKIFYCDQLDKIAIRDLWSQPVLQGSMDIIDDGHHAFETNTLFLDGSLEGRNLRG